MTAKSVSVRSMKKEFVAALKSDKFKQTRDFLREGDSFCALGVLCELFRQKTGHGSWVGPFFDTGKHQGRAAFVFKLDNEYCFELPSLQVLNWAGLTPEDAMDISQLNDKENATFAEIATYLS